MGLFSIVSKIDIHHTYYTHTQNRREREKKKGKEEKKEKRRKRKREGTWRAQPRLGEAIWKLEKA